MRSATRQLKMVVALMALALIASACSSDDPNAASDLVAGGNRPIVTVQPRFDMTPLTIDVLMTDQGFEPEIIFIPAGRPIQLVLRNRGTTEHHYRIKGLVPSQLRWMEFPIIDDYDAADMTPEQLAAYGIADIAGMTDQAEIEHVLHHIQGSFQPMKAASPTGIKPLGTEVHGYAILGTVEIMEFIALQTGEYESDDVRFPDITGRVIVFEMPPDAGTGS